MKKTGGGKSVTLDPIEWEVIQSSDGRVKMTGIPGIEETGKNLNEFHPNFIIILLGCNFTLVIVRCSTLIDWIY